MPRKWTALAVALMALPCLSAAAATTPRAAKVLETFAAGDFQYQLAVEPCRKRKCPITIHLLKDGKPIDKKPLPQAATDREFTHRPVSPAGLFSAAPPLRMWESGEGENDYVGVFAQAAPLDATHTGLLVTQLTGFERIYHSHALYAVADGKLKKFWSSGDSVGPTSTAVYPVVHQGKSYLLFQKTRAGYSSEDGQGYSPDGEMPDSYQASLLHWQADKMAVETIPLPAAGIPLYLAVIGFYPDMAQAEQAAWKTECQVDDKPDGASPMHLRQFTYILAAADYKQLAHKGKIMLGHISFSRDEARKFQQGLKTCKPALDAEIVEIK